MRFAKLKKLAPIVPLLLAGTLVWLLVARDRSPDRSPPSERVMAVRYVSPVSVKLAPKAVGTGTSRPGSVWQAVAQVGATVSELMPDFRDGAMAPAETVLARFDDSRYQLAVRELEAEIERLEADLAQLDATAANLEASLAIERRSLELNEADVARAAKQLEKKVVPESELEIARLSALKQEIVVTNLENEQRLLPSKRTAMLAQKTAAENRLAVARLDLAHCVIEVPFDARLSDSSCEVGQYVPAGTVIAGADGIGVTEVVAQLRLGQMQRIIPKGVRDDLDVPLSAAARKEMGRLLGVVVRLKHQGSEVSWKGRMVGFGDSIDSETQTVAVVVAVDDPYEGARIPDHPPLVKGMFVEVELRGPELDAMVIPEEALRGDAVVVMDAEDRLRRRPVKVRFRQEGLAVIDEGLALTDRVVVSDPVPAIPGMLLDGRSDETVTARLLGTSGR